MELKLLLLTLFLPLAHAAQAQKYEADWASLDSRPMPDWYQDAKFGIFIHWGPYSVPAWSPKGTYEEWYQHWFQEQSIFGNGDFSGQEIPDFHQKNYGEDFSYYDFAKLFTAELYNPQQWADLFKRAGAKYVVMTSKHHDGFCLWPSKEAGAVRGFPWNSMDVGARRDLVGEYMQAIRGAGLKAGLYYSLYEWYHPWYRDKPNLFVDKHYHPQFKDLVTRYAPDLLFADGEWEHEDDYWKSSELIAWLYNDSPATDQVVINDRWFKGSRHHHGDYYTTEYEVEDMEGTHPWEESRGMGLSYGYNRAEDIEDYTSPQAFILMLVDIVSRGGNLLLNIGPRADGKIPVIMQERLLQIGDWLKVNGEAIYGTKQWKRSCQWSEGSRDFDFKQGKLYVEGSYILQLTLNPMQGQAVKQLYFTSKGEAVYVTIPKWPGKQIVISDLDPAQGAVVTLLGVEGKLKWKQSKGKLIIDMPAYDPAWKISDYAYVLRISSVQ
jgi:alpha-L-fucosidase